MKSDFFEKVSMEFDFGNCGAIVSQLDFEFVVQTHARVLYSIPGLMVVHFESVRLKKMSMTLETFVEIMSPTCFEIVAVVSQKTSRLFSNSDFSSIRCSRKGVYEV